MSEPMKLADVAALISGAPAADPGAAPTPALVAAERAIAALRVLLGALAQQAGGSVTVPTTPTGGDLGRVQIFVRGAEVVIQLDGPPPPPAPPPPRRTRPGHASGERIAALAAGILTNHPGAGDPAAPGADPAPPSERGGAE